MNKKEFLGNKYVPEYARNYFSKPWYERDLMGYFNYLDYQEMSKQPTKYFEQKKVINFDIIHHESRGDKLQGSYEGYQTVKKKDLEKYPGSEKKKTISGLVRNIKRDDLYIEKDIVKDHFLK